VKDYVKERFRCVQLMRNIAQRKSRFCDLRVIVPASRSFSTGHRGAQADDDQEVAEEIAYILDGQRGGNKYAHTHRGSRAALLLLEGRMDPRRYAVLSSTQSRKFIENEDASHPLTTTTRRHAPAQGFNSPVVPCQVPRGYEFPYAQRAAGTFDQVNMSVECKAELAGCQGHNSDFPQLPAIARRLMRQSDHYP